jgi:hypothetical protein
MSNSTIVAMLTPGVSRPPRAVREYEILRILGEIAAKSPEAVATTARREIIAWTQKRSGKGLPPEAWGLGEFEHFAGGRNSRGVRFQTEKTDIWAIRADDPDKNVAGRIWTTEATVWNSAEGPVRVSARLLVSTDEGNLPIVPTSPGFIQQLVDACGISAGPYDIRVEPKVVGSSEEAEDLVNMLLDPQRRLPVVVLSTSPSCSPLLDPQKLSKKAVGLAHVVVLPAEHTWHLTERLGKPLSVFLGAIRTYLPGLTRDTNPYDHKLTLAESLSNENGIAACERQICVSVADFSIRQNLLGRDVISFAALRNLSAEIQQERLIGSGASDSVQLDAAKKRIEALNEELKQKEELEKYILAEQRDAEERAQDAEMRQRASSLQIQELLQKLKARGDTVDGEAELPQSWEEFVSWCDSRLTGRLVLTPVARRNVKSPEYENVEEVAKCLLWLATECRNRRIEGGDGSVRDEPILQGIKNAHCGGDTYTTKWQGQTVTVDWHVKNGGNTRDPRRCLRIYYFWEPTSNQIVVADLPAHRTTDAT